LQAVVDYGGFAQAAEVLHKTQSSISYTISKLEQILDIEKNIQFKNKAATDVEYKERVRSNVDAKQSELSK